MLRLLSSIRWGGFLLVVCLAAGMLYYCKTHLALISNIISLLPGQDPAIADAQYVFTTYAPHDVVVIDIGLVSEQGTTDDLVHTANTLKNQLQKSGLFTSAGNDEVAVAMPELYRHVVDHLPVLFTAEELERNVAPLLNAEEIRSALRRDQEQLGTMEGIGQAEAIGKDPLGLRNLVLSRLSSLNISPGAHIYRNHIISADDRHLLLIGHPAGSGTDTITAKKLAELIEQLDRQNAADTAAQGISIQFTPIGAYRASLDNEAIARRDTERATLCSTIGIGVLLLLSAPRPLFSLLALMPALFGTIAALFTMALVRGSLSILTIGFGGAVISFTVDYGIIFILFLVRREDMRGRTAAREIWSGGVIATLTTVGSYVALLLTSFPIYREIGIFAALGVVYSFFFVQFIFPKIFPFMPGARSTIKLPFERLSRAMYRSSGRVSATLMVTAFIGMTWYMHPTFQIDINAINTVTKQTLEAETTIKRRWGDLSRRGFVLIEDATVGGLLERSDRLTGFLVTQLRHGALADVFGSSMVWPGKTMAESNRAAWLRFWSSERLKRFEGDFLRVADELGFSADFFAAFHRSIEAPPREELPMPSSLFPLLGIKTRPGGGYMAAVQYLPSTSYNAENMYYDIAEGGLGRMLDLKWFSQRLSTVIGDTFTTMLIIVGIVNLLMLIVYFMDLHLILLAAMPVVFALIATLGTLTLIGQAVDVTVIIMAIVSLGMGINYGLYFICSYQRYRDDRGPFFESIVLGVFLAATSTIIGFGGMALSEHALLRSAGVITMLSIGYSMLAAFFLVPVFLRRMYASSFSIEAIAEPGSRQHHRFFRKRYRHAETSPRMFAWFKTKLDPMFPGLARNVHPGDRILDIGSGYGVPMAWLATCRPNLRIVGVEPDYERARIANGALRGNGSVVLGAAPLLPETVEPFDVVFMIDSAHYLSNEAFAATLHGVYERLHQNGRFILRATVPSARGVHFYRCHEVLRQKLRDIPCYYRPAAEIKNALEQAGFMIERIAPAAPGREETWFYARPGPEQRRTP